MSVNLDAVAFFESYTPGADADALLAVMAIVSPQLLSAVGDPTLVPPGAWAVGRGAGWVMPTFTTRYHRPSRFTDGAFGIWYAAYSVEIAVAETLYHHAIRLRESGEPAQLVHLQLLSADIAGYAAEVWRISKPLLTAIHDPSSYTVSQAVGAHLRDRGTQVIIYRSVRHTTHGGCAAVVQPSTVRNCTRVGDVRYQWDGTNIGVVAAPQP